MRWPPERARARNFYLASQGRANTEAGDGALEDAPRRRAAAIAFTFDPRDPAPTRGGAVCCNPRVFPWGRWTSARWSSAATCWSSRRIRSNKISKWWDR